MESAERLEKSRFKDLSLTMRELRQRLKNAEAAEIAEAALVLPVVFVFLLGIIWFGRAFNIYSTIQQAAQQGAIVAARPTCATCGPPPSQWVSTDFPGDTTVVNTVSAVMQASSLNPAQIITNSNSPSAGCSTTSNITICRELLLNPQPGQVQQCSIPPQEPQICGTLVTFQYPFQFYLPFTSLNLSQIILTAEAQSRMEN